MFWVHSDVIHSDDVRARSPEQAIVDYPKTASIRGEELRSQLVQAAEQLNISQARIRQLEAQLKQAPAPVEFDEARNQAAELRSQLSQASEQLNLSQARIDHLEAQLKQAADRSELDKARKQGEDLHSQLVQAKEQLNSAHARVGQPTETAARVSAGSKSAQGRHAGALLEDPKAASSWVLSESVLSKESREPNAEEAPAGANSRNAVLTALFITPTATSVAGADKLLMQRDSGSRNIPAGQHARVFPEQTVPLDTVAEPGVPVKQPAATEIVQPAEPPERGFSAPVAVSNAASDPPPLLAPGAVATGSPGAAPTVQRTARASKIPLALPHLAAVEVAALLARGDSLLGVGDIISARLFYERGSNAGDGRAALRMGATYDPGFLDRAHLPHLSGDVGQALLWYRRARDLGEGDAELWIQGLEPKSGR